MDSSTSLVFLEDTIIAVSTPSGRGAISVVRVSGPKAFEILAQSFRPEKHVSFPLPPRHAVHGWVTHEGEDVDEALATCFPAPNSYTGENLVELSVHGNPLLVERVIQGFVQRGIRPARPGEFTFRAFRNGRMALADAEAVNDLIQADTRVVQRLALRNLRGELSRRLSRLGEDLESLLVRIETELEFEDQDTGANGSRALEREMGTLRREMEALARGAARQRSHARGVITVLCGRPNVGKSTLLNTVLSRERALVSPEPGTTRDTLEEMIELDGLPFLFIDTAGLRSEAGGVEALGIERTRQALSEADAAWFLIDLSEGVQDADREWLSRLNEVASEARVFYLGNKCDLLLPSRREEHAVRAARALGVPEVYVVSAEKGFGVSEILTTLREWAEQADVLAASMGVWVNARQGLLIEEARACLERAEEGRENGLTLDLIAEELHVARRILAELEGRRISPDLLDRIFSTFCVGK